MNGVVRIFFPVAGTLLLAGCVSTPLIYPLVDPSKQPVTNSFLANTQACLKDVSGAGTCAFVSDSLQALQIASGYYQDQAVQKDQWRLGLGDGVFFGSLAAVAGGLVKVTGLLNGGAGVAATSAAAAGHYNPSGQAVILARAATTAMCYQNALIITSDQAVQSLLGVGNPTYRQDALTMMDGVIVRLQQMHANLNTDMRNLTTTSYTVDQLTDLVSKSRPTATPLPNIPHIAQADAKNARVGFAYVEATPNDTDKQLSSWDSDVKTVLARMDLCTVTTK